jgi:diacylglycerol kinase (CTP)
MTEPRFESWLEYQLRSRSQQHLSRKFFHMLSGSIIGFLFIGTFTRLQSISLLVPATILLVFLDLIRLRWPALNRVVFKFVGNLMREEEAKGPSAQVYYLLGLCWAVSFLPRAIAIQAIFTLAWMDPIAAIFGVRHGRRTWRSVFAFLYGKSRTVSYFLGAKTVEGSAAGFLAAFLAGVIAWTGPWAAIRTAQGIWWPEPWLVFQLSVIGGLTSVVAEAWPTQWDDNINIPFWTGVVVWVTVSLMNIPLNFL